MTIGLGIGLGITIGGNGTGGSGVLPDFAYQAETETLAAAFTTPPTRRVKRSMDYYIKTLKQAGIWSKGLGLWKVGADQQSSLINWISPGTRDLIVVGSPTFVAYSHFAPAANARLRTQINLTDIDPANVTIFEQVRSGASNSASDMGALGANGFGLSMCAQNTSGSLTGRCGSANQTSFGVTGASGDWVGDGIGFRALTRKNNTNVQAYNGPVRRDDIALASQTMQSVEINLLAINNNGTYTISPRSQSCWGIFQGLTESEMNILANATQQLDIEFLYGDYDTYDAGTQPAAPTAVDVIVYGATPSSLLAAYEIKRQGMSVAIVGGWRERHIGGMSAGGLGYTDFRAPTKLGGLSRWVITQMQTIQSKTSTDFTFQPRYFDQVIRGMFDPRISTGLDIPIYWSTGVATVQKTGARITGFTTNDGRTFTGTYFFDGSYEGDLEKAAGVSTRLGRESSAEFGETGAGFRGTLTGVGSDSHQYKNAAGVLINVDPYNTPGDAGSGILPSLQGTMGVDTPAVGAGDSRVQSYNFRMTATTTRAYRKPFPSTPPAGYNVAMYEPLLRRLAIDPTISMDDIFILNVIDTTCFDLNANGGFSLDLWGASTAYPAANNAQREVIWKQHWNHILGLFYLLQYDPDSRVPAALRTEALTYGFHMKHYCKPHPNDDYQANPQLYVREAYRLDNDFMVRDSDMTGTDGTTPRSIKTVTMASYEMDSHHMWSLADPNGGTPRIWNEGNFFRGMGGTDEAAPVAYEALTPRKTECENLLIGFGVAATHVAFGSYRMEFTAGQAGQSAAHAFKIAKANSNQAVQDVDYPTMRTSILASATLSGETAPVLDQVN